MRHLSGPFSAKDLGHGVWRLTTEPAGPEIYLEGAGPAAFQDDARITRVSVEWRLGAVHVAAASAQGLKHFTARSALIHEPQTRLYESLPLARFDAGARRFWRRVFALVRIPGGRWLLGVLARRRRQSGTAAQ